MPKYTTIVASSKDGREFETCVLTFGHTIHLEHPLGTIKRAIRDFLDTDDGKAAWEDSLHDFNWGSIAEYIPDSWWDGYGLILTLSTSADYHVAHDEVFKPRWATDARA